MTTLDKLSIQNVRAYGEHAQVIEFLKPLTIIVGQNGSGKTTVIEALKYATTGELPPLTDKGKGFVHDPKVVGTQSVKAAIKLSFRTPSGKPMAVQRVFQVTQKRATSGAESKQEFKALESVIRSVDDQNQPIVLSHRTADVDRIVPLEMGVNRAILEHVIFCHQEDSTWPLSDAKTLKSRFDEIFASERYTKAVDEVKKLIKEKTDEMKSVGHLAQMTSVLIVDVCEEMPSAMSTFSRSSAVRP